MKKIFGLLAITALIALIANSHLHAQQWKTVLPDSLSLNCGYIAPDNSTLLGGYIKVDNSFSNGLLILMDSVGQYETWSFPTIEDRHLGFNNILPLSNGGRFVCGLSYVYQPGTLAGDLVIMIIDENMVTVNEQIIQAEKCAGFGGSSAVIDDDGSIVVMATALKANSYGGFDRHGAMFRFSEEGNLLQHRYLIADPPDPLGYMFQMYDQQLINDPFSNRLVALCRGIRGIQSVLLFDHNFNLLEEHGIEDLSIPDTIPYSLFRIISDPRSDYWYNGNEMLMCAYQGDTNQSVHNHPHVLVGRMNLQGEITEKTEIVKPDTLYYTNSMAYANDTTVYVSVRCHTENWIGPTYAQVYLMTTNLEILWRIELWDEMNHVPNFVLATNEGGCEFLYYSDPYYFDQVQNKIIRFSRDDFHPISISVKETPMVDLQAKAFPNPTKDELNIDISSLPQGVEHRIRITDVQGRPCLDRVIHGQGNVLTLYVVNLPDGIYTYSIYSKDRNLITGKFIKE